MPWRKFDTRTWIDEVFRTLSHREKLVALYVLTGQSNRIGLFYFSTGRAAQELAMSHGQFRAALRRVGAGLEWEWDETASVIYIPSWWKYNAPENPSHLKGCLKDLHGVPNTPLLARFCANTRYLPEYLFDTLSTAVAHLSDTSPARVPHQELELKQEQKQRETAAPPSLPADGVKVKSKDPPSEGIGPGRGVAAPRDAAPAGGETAALVAEYHALPGVTVGPDDRALIGGLCAKHGAAAMRRALREAGGKIGEASDSLPYLCRVVANIAAGRPAPRGVPKATAYDREEVIKHEFLRQALAQGDR